MDKRGRDAEKRYRNKANDITYRTVSLILAQPVYEELEKAVGNEFDKNMSRYIEENIDIDKIIVIDKNRVYKQTPTIKKTFTFSEKFVQNLKKSGNMSLTVENILKEKFDIK